MKFLSNLSIISILVVIAVFYSFTSTESDLLSSGHYGFSFVKVKCCGGLCKRFRRVFSCCSGNNEEEGQQDIVIGSPTDFVHLQSGGGNIRGPDGQFVPQTSSTVTSVSHHDNLGYQSNSEDENEDGDDSSSVTSSGSSSSSSSLSSSSSSLSSSSSSSSSTHINPQDFDTRL